jgi:2-polyprenyl-6-hydroxyphenyl methylase/3-demethylubiquinone-9 3-methyltransferase
LPWTVEKSWYTKASATTQARARALYVALMRAAFLFTGRSFGAYVDDYRLRRGMSFEHDVHDWLGGYPYQSISQSEVHKRMTGLRFQRIWSTPKRISIGLFGTGCDEYLYERLADGAAG